MGGRLRVLVVGPKATSAHSRGGMASVIALMREHRDDRVAITTVATYVDDPKAARLATGVAGMLTSALLILARRADVVHVHLAHKGSVVRKAVPLFACRVAGVPAVVHAHSYDFAGWFDGLSARTQRLVRHALGAQRVLVLGDTLAEPYRTRLGLAADQVQVVRNPAPLPPHVPRRDYAPEVRAVFLGRMGERKGSYDLVSAVALLPTDVRAHLRIVAAGDGEVDEVRDAAEQAGVTDVLTVRGWAEADERDRLLAEAEILLLPSYDEGLPMALLEAMAWGLVPVVTTVGGIGEVVHDGVDSVVVQAGDTASIAEALSRLVPDAQLRHRLGTAARVRAGDFTVAQWFDSLVGVWRQVVRD